MQYKCRKKTQIAEIHGISAACLTNQITPEFGVSDFFGGFDGDGIFAEFTEDRINRLESVSGSGIGQMNGGK